MQEILSNSFKNQVKMIHVPINNAQKTFSCPKSVFMGPQEVIGPLNPVPRLGRSVHFTAAEKKSLLDFLFHGRFSLTKSR